MMPRPAHIGGVPSATHAPRERLAPRPGALARRRIVITLTKYLLPAAAIALLTTVALWPDFSHRKDAAWFNPANFTGDIDGARLRHARYHGVNEKGEPYTLTTDTAKQLDAERVELTKPQGDIAQAGGTWVNLKADHGIFMQKANTLDLWQNVVLYRDDGTTLNTASVTMDLKGGSAVGGEPVHAEGPFGILDAQGFSLTEKGTAIQFIGPAHVVLNGASP
jgi:lipopolysaccharide export system protein LptC